MLREREAERARAPRLLTLEQAFSLRRLDNQIGLLKRALAR